MNEVLAALPGGSKSLAKLLQLPDSLGVERLRGSIAPEFCTQFAAVLKSLPIFIVNSSISKIISESNPADSNDGVLRPGGSLKYEIRLGIRCNRGDPSFRVYAPRYHRSKLVSWWIVIEASDHNLLAIKRVELRDKTATITVPVAFPDDVPRDIRIALIADSVMDIGITLDVPETSFSL